MTDTNTVAAGAAEQRPIPPLPGGGSWRFDEAAWEWVSNDPAPANESTETTFETETATQE